MHRALHIDDKSLRGQIQRRDGVRGKVKVQGGDVKILARHVCHHMLHLRMIVHAHPLGGEKVGHAELMLRFCLQSQVVVGHLNRQMQVPDHGLIGQFGVKYQSGGIDLIIDATGQVHRHFALHHGRMRVQTFSLRVYFAGQFRVGAVFEERVKVHFLNIHQHVIHLIVNIIETLQVRLVALIIGFA